MSFNNSSSVLLSTTFQILEDVQNILSTLEKGFSFNVDDFSKRNATKYNVEPLYIATLVRTAVRNSTDFVNKKGRNGGVVHADLELARKQEQQAKAEKAASKLQKVVAVPEAPVNDVSDNNVSAVVESPESEVAPNNWEDFLEPVIDVESDENQVSLDSLDEEAA